MIKSAVIAFTGLFVAASSGHAALMVTAVDDADILANTIAGSGITITPTTPAIIGTSSTTSPSQFGTFTGGASVGGGFFDQGIVLSTGNVLDAIGPVPGSPNTADDITTAYGNPGDSDLDLLSAFTTQDAATLSFEFQTTGGDLFFNFVFASDEYNEFIGSPFNDVFGFYVDGVNIALVPGTSSPVAVNTVNGTTNSGFYNDNDFGSFNPNFPFDIEYDGFTDVFRAQALGLGAGTHTMKIAIADASDDILDSAVFIQAGTFSDTTSPTEVPEPTALLLFALGLFGVGYFGIARRRAA
jgi:hypothetical protein